MAGRQSKMPPPGRAQRSQQTWRLEGARANSTTAPPCSLQLPDPVPSECLECPLHTAIPRGPRPKGHWQPIQALF